MNVWPLVAVISDSDFIQNEAFMVQNYRARWTKPAGPQRRSGATSFTATGNHHDGGFSSAGIFYVAVGTLIRLDGDAAEEPDATWTVSIQRSSWVRSVPQIARP
eukprot:COSAG04_NODE_637_length_11700_cov_478.131885_8_plen_104_part_00